MKNSINSRDVGLINAIMQMAPTFGDNLKRASSGAQVSAERFSAAQASLQAAVSAVPMALKRGNPRQPIDQMSQALRELELACLEQAAFSQKAAAEFAAMRARVDEALAL